MPRQRDEKHDEESDNAPNEVKKEEDVKVIPPKQVYNHDLKKIKSYRKLRRSHKLNNAKSVFITDMRCILECFKVEDHKLDCELLVEVLNIAESYFIYGKKIDRDESKQEAVKKLMLPYFLDDELVLEKTITNVWNKVKKSNTLKRCLRRFINFFCLKRSN